MSVEPNLSFWPTRGFPNAIPPASAGEAANFVFFGETAFRLLREDERAVFLDLEKAAAFANKVYFSVRRN